MNAHTPGPWRVDAGHSGDVSSIAGNVAVALYRGMSLIEVTGQESTLAEISREEAKANARLIAAAPELLEALQEVSDRLQIHMKHSEDLVAHMRAVKVIAKATGAA